MDTEADSLHSYYEKVCLIQLAVDGQHFLVDPLAGANLSALIEALSGTTLVLHGADYDLRMLSSDFDFRPAAGVIDTMIAARLVGHRRFGLGNLVEEYFGASLGKGGQKSDWSRRPLKESQLRYAVEDVVYLLPLADRLETELRRLGRWEWLLESSSAVTAAALAGSPPDDREPWRIKHLRGLTGRQLALVRGIWRWREDEARRADLPPFKVLNNSRIIDLAKWASENPRRPLEEGPSLPRTCRRRRLDQLRRAVKAALNLPEEELPEHPASRGRRRETPPELAPLRSRVAALGRDLDIEPSVIAPKAALTRIAVQRPRSVEDVAETGELLHWQATLIAPAVRDVLHGSDG